MGTKHDLLTDEELATFQVDAVVRRAIDENLKDPTFPRERINILDWGCGRGRSVAKLREAGFNAYGVDIDEHTMRNGYRLFEQRGLDPRGLLLNVTDTSHFPDGFFHCIFSEQVFEHIKDLSAVLAELARLTILGGFGIHRFPASRNMLEEHLFMPFVHWLPKNSSRKVIITSLLALGCGPKPPWVETQGHGFWFTVETYYNYLNNKTYYRDILDICDLASHAGFSHEYDVGGRRSHRRAGFLSALWRNGFPRGSVTLRLTKLPKAPVGDEESVKHGGSSRVAGTVLSAGTRDTVTRRSTT